MPRFRLGAVAMLLTATVSLAQSLPKGAIVDKDIAYGQHEKQKIDLYRMPSEKPQPLVVWIHGGGWAAGSKNDQRPAQLLLPEGYAVASIGYRFSQHAIYPAQAADVRNAIRFLRANAKKYNIDPQHIGVWGASAGGHLVAVLGTGSDIKELDGKEGTPGDARVQAVIDWFGPTELSSMTEATTNPKGLIPKLLGGTLAEKPELAKLASPLYHVTPDDAPTLIFHGDKDPLVPLAQSEIFAKAMKKAGVECELVVVPGAGHGGKDFFSEANRQKALTFLAKHLK
ncbi:MAG: alpha/beta hydrolase [Bacteroidales bacterium]|nr:alpha/beta hydrolase [Bacteroidales bacterium]